MSIYLLRTQTTAYQGALNGMRVAFVSIPWDLFNSKSSNRSDALKYRGVNVASLNLTSLTRMLLEGIDKAGFVLEGEIV